MRRLFEAGLFVAGTGFGFLGQALMEASALCFAYLCFSLAAVCFAICFLLWISKKLWSGRNDWYATSFYPTLAPDNDPERAIDKDRRKQWQSSEPQKEGAWFEVDMGKPRMIASIECLADNSGVEKPAKWRMMFYGEGRRTLGHRDGEYFIYVKDDMPRLIQCFRVLIKEVAEDMPKDTNYAKRYGEKVFWAISTIRLREYRFSIFGKRFGTHEL